VLAVILIVCQTASPVPRQAADQTARSNNNVKNKAGNQHSQSGLSLPIRDQTASDDQDKRNKPSNTNTEETVLIPEVAPVPIKDRWDKASVILAGCLVIIGGFGVIYAIKTLDQVKAQAIAAKDSLDLSRDTAQRQLRAYVRVYAANIEFRVPDRPVIEVHFKNCGATPAYRVRTWIGLGLGEWPLNKALPAPPEGFQGSRSVLAPGGQEIMPAVWKQPIPAPLLPFLGTRQATVYVFGRTEYIDTFKNAWYTEFRLLHGGPEPVKLDANKDGILVGKLKPDQEGNEAT